MNHSKRVFLISWHFPPYKASSGFNLFKRIKEARLHFDVVQLQREASQKNLSMFHYTRATFDRHEIELLDEDSRSITNRDVFVSSCIEIFERLKREKHYLYLMSHSHEFVSHLAAMAIKEKYPYLNWIASFGDPVGANPYNDVYKFPLLKEDTANEQKVFEKANVIMVTNEYQKNLMATGISKENANKFRIIPHCFDKRMFPPVYREPGPFRFMHIGMLYKFKRTSEPFIKAVDDLLERHPEYAGKFTVHFYGANDKYIKEAEAGSLKGIVGFRGVVSYGRSLELMQEADALLLRDADFSDVGLSDTPFLPGKLADYLGARKPVIAVTMKTGCVPDLMQSLNMPCTTENAITDLANYMKQAIDADIHPNYEVAQSYQSCYNAPLVESIFRPLKKSLNILFAGHDFKFIAPLMQELEADPGYNVLVDQWQGHNNHEVPASLQLLDQADIIFCEWGLGNAVWYSHHKKHGQKLIVRMHLQEIETSFPTEFNIDKIDNFITISPHWYEQFQKKFDLPRQKLKMIYNLIACEAFDQPKFEGVEFNLALVGIVPQRKRFDRALDILEKLYEKDHRYKLFIKGKLPEDYPWMKSRKWVHEMEYYKKEYKRIQQASWRDNVIFNGFSNNMPKWFRNIGWTLSVSDFEGSHQAPAEGMASGSVPVLINWDGGKTVYPKEFIFDSTTEMVKFIHDNHDLVGSQKLKNYSNINFDKSIIFLKIKEMF